jgi:hypothetical protein
MRTLHGSLRAGKKPTSGGVYHMRKQCIRGLQALDILTQAPRTPLSSTSTTKSSSSKQRPARLGTQRI